MTVSVCIVSYRSSELVIACLAALAASTCPDFSVVICENGGAAAVMALRGALPEKMPGGQRISVIDPAGNVGFARATNLAMAVHPEVAAWWLLNPDTRPSPGALSALLDRLEEGDVDAVGGVLHFADGTVQGFGGHWRPWLGRTVSIGHGSRSSEPADRETVERRQNFILGASMLVSRRFVQLTGPMREDYFLYCEEIEWALRAARNGAKLGYAPAALVLHEEGSITGSGGDRRARPKLPVYLDERNRINLTIDTKPALLPIVVLALLIQNPIRYLRFGAWRQAGYALAGLIAGLRGERGPPIWLEP